MKSYEIRALARESLQNKWGKVAVFTLIYAIISSAISTFLSKVPVLGNLPSLVVTPVLSYGFLVTLINLSRNSEAGCLDFLNNGFSLFGKIWGIIFHTFIKMILPFLTFFIGSIIQGLGSFVTSSTLMFLIGTIIFILGLCWIIVKSYSFMLTSFILNDEPHLKCSEIVEKSAKLMNGNKFRFFCLGLSFIGWSILGITSLGIGYLWLLPYTQIASLKFYEEIVSSDYSESTNTYYDNLV